MKIQSVDLDGQLIRVGIRPANSALPPLLIFNGIGANLELLEPFVEALGDVEVIIFDVPGVGGSPTPRKPYRFSTLCVLTDRLLTEIGYNGPVDVLGVSWGGALAQQFARRYPKRCRRLVLAATTPGVIMFPARLSVLLKMLGPRRYRDPPSFRKSVPKYMVARTDATLSCSRSTATTCERPMGAATSISFLHCGDGAACCGCDACHSPRSSYMGTTIQSSP
ncbi:Poly(3-hydroxyalkanoate) depolymerase [Caballeronia hypogeia]|uniref:Poly(3-hydroxyalkanoate) depolymerase n=1 Tax=Caballeronia hypogeia TaxID=1777140 RepID=A0A158AV44_9BURK|nr:Poly(3-hydroxyalkanoate) depolymerase [Caballeronia hypogeia]